MGTKGWRGGFAPGRSRAGARNARATEVLTSGSAPSIPVDRAPWEFGGARSSHPLTVGVREDQTTASAPRMSRTCCPSKTEWSQAGSRARAGLPSVSFAYVPF